MKTSDVILHSSFQYLLFLLFTLRDDFLNTSSFTGEIKRVLEHHNEMKSYSCNITSKDL